MLFLKATSSVKSVLLRIFCHMCLLIYHNDVGISLSKILQATLSWSCLILELHRMALELVVKWSLVTQCCLHKQDDIPFQTFVTHLVEIFAKNLWTCWRRSPNVWFRQSENTVRFSLVLVESFIILSTQVTLIRLVLVSTFIVTALIRLLSIVSATLSIELVHSDHFLISSKNAGQPCS